MPNILDEQVQTFRSGFWLADLLTLLWSGPSRVPFDDRLKQQTQASTVVSWSEGNGDLCPPVYYGVSGDYTLVLVSCVQGLNMAVNLMNGYAVPAVTSGPKENAWAKAAAQWIVARARTAHMPSTTKMLLAGYSGGGMIVQSLAQAFSALSPAPSIRLATFGSPREAQASFCESLARQNVVRWMNDTDPVPLLPPRISEAPGFSILLPYALAQAYVEYVHFRNGTSLNAAGQWQSAEVPPGASLAATASLGAWLLGQVTGEGGPHRIQEYRARLDAGLQARPAPEPALPPTPQEEENEVTGGEWKRARNNGARALFEQAEVQNAVPTVIPDRNLAFVKREGRIYNVYWGDVFIAAGPKKKSALQMKNRLNNLLRSMQHQGVVIPENFVQQFIGYVQLATGDGNGFQPVMADTFPGG